MIKTYLLVSSMFFAVTTSVCAQQAKPPQKADAPVTAKVQTSKKAKFGEPKTLATTNDVTEGGSADSNKALQAATAEKVAKRLKISQPNPSSSK